MEAIVPPIGDILNIWWGVPSVLWILATTEGLKRWTPISPRISWLLHIAIGVAGAALWTHFGPPPEAESVAAAGRCLPQRATERDLATEIALGIRAAFLASGLFLAASELLRRNRSADTQ